MSAYVEVYNLGGQEIMGRVSLKHAITMLHKHKARVLRAVSGETFGPYEKPTAVELLKYVYAKWKYSKTGVLPFSRMSVFRRDNFTCAYCLKKLVKNECTMDHVIPRSRWKSSGMNGTPTTYQNVVTSCFSCNNKKKNQTPKEAGMPLRFMPTVPSFKDAYEWGRD